MKPCIPDSLRNELDLYSSGLTQVAGENLIAVYLYGSLARGCYNSSTSDIDIIAVTESPCTDEVIQGIVEVHRSANLPTDVVFVTKDQLNTDAFPTPVDFLVKPSGCIRREPDGNRDFLTQREDAYEAGISLLGMPPKELMHPVPWELLRKSLDFLFPYIVTHFKNPMLMLCRMVYADRCRKLSSKREAGE